MKSADLSNQLTERREFLRRSAAGVAALAALGGVARGDEPADSGVLIMKVRRREGEGDGTRVVEETLTWKAAETAIILCDMWADHPCRLAAERVAEMAPRMNEVVTAARERGIAIIHAPSGGVQHYEETPFRERMKQAPYAKPPVKISNWCPLDPAREGKLPIVDDVRRGEAEVTGCDDPQPRKHEPRDRHQHAAIRMTEPDGVSDNGQEIFNLLRHEGRRNVILMGVHANMCILGRPFGIRQQVALGHSVVLCRDLTDAMYDPRDPPYVSHARGVELVIEHIERWWCGTILAESLTDGRKKGTGNRE